MSTAEEARRVAIELMEEGVWCVAAAEAGGHLRYRFTHALTKGIVYRAMPEDQRVALHGAVLTAIEQGQALVASRGDEAKQLAEMARHARAARLHLKATCYFLRSAKVRGFP